MPPPGEFAELQARIRECTPEEVPALLGQLEVLRATAWARLLAIRERTQVPERGSAPAHCLTMPRAAEQTGININTLREAGRRGQLPTVHIGRSVYVREESLERWVAARESKRP